MLKNKMQKKKTQTLHWAAVNEDEKKGTVAVFEGDSEVIPHQRLIYGVKPYPALQTKPGIWLNKGLDLSVVASKDMIHSSAHYTNLAQTPWLFWIVPSLHGLSNQGNWMTQTSTKKTLSFHTQQGWDSAQPWGTECFFSCNHNLALGSATITTPQAFPSLLFLECFALTGFLTPLLLTPLSFFASSLQYFTFRHY